MSSRLFGIFVVLLAIVCAVAGYIYYYAPEKIPPKVAEILDRPRAEVELPMDAEEAAGQILPTFDIVRVDASGSAVVAGRGEGDATIIVRANGRQVAREAISETGEWAAYIDAPFDEGDVELTLDMLLPSGRIVRGEQTVVIAVPARSGEKPLTVLVEPGEPTKILQDPTQEDITLTLTLDVIDYDTEGNVSLSGKAANGALLRIYANNGLIGETRAGSKGSWLLEPQDPMAPGVYTLRIDQLNADGKVAMRVELPFERAEPAEVMAAVTMGGGRIVVQPGNSLWRIARRVYGSGYEYTIIYDGNRDQIRNPDVIYAGQILDLPVKTVVDDEVHTLEDQIN